MGLSRTISEINGDFRRKSHFPHIFCAPSEWVFLGNGYWLSGSKKHNQGPTGLRNKFDDIFCRLHTIDQRDRRTVHHRQQRPRVRIASRGKNDSVHAKCHLPTQLKAVSVSTILGALSSLEALCDYALYKSTYTLH